MKKLSTILRLLALVILLVGLGIVQPAAAQQTVTLSGRVTDSAGQAVSGARVELFHQPDHIWTDGQDTDGTGAYRLSVPPGTYQLEVRPPHGPFIPQRQELTLSTNTTQNVILETGVTLSGQVSGSDGQPPSWVYLSVRNDAGQEISFAWTDTGRYSLGVPVGTYRIDVDNDDFLDKMVEGVAITQDTVLNITLDSGVLLEGKVLDDAGQPAPAARVCTRLPAEELWEGYCSETGSEGHFQLSVAPAVYVVTVTPLAPLQPTRRRLEVGKG